MEFLVLQAHPGKRNSLPIISLMKHTSLLIKIWAEINSMSPNFITPQVKQDNKLQFILNGLLQWLLTLMKSSHNLGLKQNSLAISSQTLIYNQEILFHVDFLQLSNQLQDMCTNLDVWLNQRREPRPIPLRICIQQFKSRSSKNLQIPLLFGQLLMTFYSLQIPPPQSKCGRHTMYIYHYLSRELLATDSSTTNKYLRHL